MRRQNGPNQSSLPRLCESRKWNFMLYMLESNDCVKVGSVCLSYFNIFKYAHSDSLLMNFFWPK